MQKTYLYHRFIRHKGSISKMSAICLWAFASGLPMLLLTSTLSARLLQSGMTLEKIGFFSLVILPYALKFVYAPIVEYFSIPILNKHLGHARAWMVTAMTGMMFSLIWLASIHLQRPGAVYWLFIAALTSAICSAVNDIAEAEMRIGMLQQTELPLGTACYILGYGFGELIASSGTLILASLYGWSLAYLLTASLILIGIITVCLKQGNHKKAFIIINNNTAPSFSLKLFARKIKSGCNLGFITPLKSLFSIPGWSLILGIIISYYAASYLSLMMTNPFYLQLGFSLTQIGTLRIASGIFILVFGSMLGAAVCSNYGTLRVLYICGFCYIIVLLSQAFLAQVVTHHLMEINNKIIFFMFVVINLFSNLIDVVSIVSYIALIAYASRSLFIATQNAMLTSLMAISKILFSSLGGYLTIYFNWFDFFIASALFVIPGLIFIRQLILINPNLESNREQFHQLASY